MSGNTGNNIVTIPSGFTGTSTNLNTKYLMSLFVPTTTINQLGKPTNMLDIFSPKFTRAVRGMIRTGYYQWHNEPITTVAFRQYRNTTCWWMIMLLSQQVHALLIPTGALLSLPDIDQFIRSLTLTSSVAGGVRIPTFTSI